MRYLALLLLPLLQACPSVPDTQPIIDATLEWKAAEDAELEKHRLAAQRAIFDEDERVNERLRAAYLQILDSHDDIAELFATNIIDWAQRVGKYDAAYVDKSLNQMVDIYLRLKAALEEDE